MFSNNNSDSFDYNNPITFSTRLADFTQWHGQNTLEDDVLEEATIFYANQFVQPDSNCRVHRRYIERNREQGHGRVFNDYIATDPVYPPNIFLRRFRMQKHVSLRLVETIKYGDNFFEDGYDRSPVFDDIFEGRAPQVNFVVNGHQYNMEYYLTDCIYLQWATFVKYISAPQIRKHKLFATYQESVRKDVERAFGVLQARFAFSKQPCLIWDENLMGKI
ncbi:uncharacterized protein LOC141587955 [Silene latifolia]|uniref:uncharacterized protein LOC141587955 n=1 Tax=Silene latifolia TaxID=37657 RepID=UPI003D787608